MKKTLSLILVALLLGSCCACSSDSNTDTSPTSTVQSETTTENITDTSALTVATTTVNDEKIQKALEKLEEYEFEGVVYVTKDGNPYFSFAKGTLEDGTPITLDTPMPIGSVSKQFCACAIMLLQEQGKLSVNDTLEKYFPEYTTGKDITLHNLLSMRSGIHEMNFDLTSVDKTAKENTTALLEDIFSRKLTSPPDKMFEYINANYFLLGNIVEKVSGKTYIDFLRENFFEPLGMTHTGSIDELPNKPQWADGHTYTQIDSQPGLTKGAGDIISNCSDMHLWLEALYTGKSISSESYKAMTTSHSSEIPYGYALNLNYEGDGIGHAGLIGSYTAQDYISETHRMTIFMDSNTVMAKLLENCFAEVLEELL